VKKATDAYVSKQLALCDKNALNVLD